MAAWVVAGWLVCPALNASGHPGIDCSGVPAGAFDATKFLVLEISSAPDAPDGGPNAPSVSASAVKRLLASGVLWNSSIEKCAPTPTR